MKARITYRYGSTGSLKHTAGQTLAQVGWISGFKLRQRIAELRKERGYTQKELAEKIDIPWTLISDYERGKLRLHDKVISKFATALEVSSDEILGLAALPRREAKPSLRIVRRLKRIETLPPSKQKALLQIIDGFLKGESQ
jgi:transcriptional regulator with XRE-family HTH domain